MAKILEQTDWEILGFVISAYISCCIITLILYFFIKNVMNDSEIEPRMKYSAIISFVSSLLYCIMIGFFRTNLIFKNLDFNDESYACFITFGICNIFGIISKYSMYILFTYRLEIVFNESVYQVSHKKLQIVRYIIIALGIMFGSLLFVWNKQQIITPKYKISLCTVDDAFDEINMITITSVIFSVIDLLVSLWLLWLFISKLYKMSKLLLFGHDKTDASKANIVKKIESQLIKATILVAICIISSLLFLFIGSFIWWPIGWFIPLDASINALSICLMYRFSRALYLLCCKPCIGCCKLCVKSMDYTIFIDMPSLFDQPKSNSIRGGKESIPPLPTKTKSVETVLPIDPDDGITIVTS